MKLNQDFLEMDEYEVNPDTLALIPFRVGEDIYARVVEMYDEFIVPQAPLAIIKHSCSFFGSSFEGRTHASQQMLSVVQKVPIVIDIQNALYLFPTASPTNRVCHWIAAEHVISFESAGIQTKVMFRNRRSYTFPLSQTMVKNQLLRTAFLKSRIMQNMNDMHKRINVQGQAMMVAESPGRFNVHSQRLQ